MDYKMEITYKIRIDFGFDQEWSDDLTSKSERVTNYANRISNNYGNDLTINYSNGGPAWNAYLIIESHEAEQTLKCAKQICNYINKFKGSYIEI